MEKKHTKMIYARMLQSVRNYEAHPKVHSSEKPYKCDQNQARLSESVTCESGRDTKESTVDKSCTSVIYVRQASVGLKFEETPKIPQWRKTIQM